MNNTERDDHTKRNTSKLTLVWTGDFSSMEIEGAEALTETSLGYFGVSNRNGLRILQEMGTKGGDDMENAAEAAMESK